VTNNVDATNFDPFYTAFLDARGRVLWDAFVYPKEKDGEWGCLVEVDADEVPSVLKHLKKHRLRKKIAIEALGEEDGISVWAGWGPEITSYLEKLRADKRTVAIMADPRAEEPTTMDPFAYRFIVKGEAPLATDTLPILDLEEYRTRRYIYGVPEGPTELPREAALPMEHNIDLASGIDFKKGCYMGQELTIRTKHTGVVRKRVLPVQLYRGGENVGVAMDTGSGDGTPKFDPNWQGPVDLAEGPLDIKQLDDEGGIKKGRSLGKLIARTGNVGLALCRLENMTPWRITAEGGSYTPGAEFGVQTSNAEEQPVRVKAFLPQWLMARQKEIWHKAKPKERTM
jgi:folate-binding protein YgfZ